MKLTEVQMTALSCMWHCSSLEHETFNERRWWLQCKEEISWWHDQWHARSLAQPGISMSLIQ